MLSAASSMWSQTSSIARREPVHVVAVERRDERAVEEVDHLVRQPVALVLELADVEQLRARLGPRLEQLDERTRDLARVRGGLGEQIEELALLGGETEGHVEVSSNVAFRKRQYHGRVVATEELTRIPRDAVADERRSLTGRTRGLVYGVAAALFLLSVVLAALRVGEQAGRLSDWQAPCTRRHPGRERAPADLLVRAPHPRPVDRELALPRGEPRLQQDLRRRPAPRDARGRGRLLLGRRRALREGVLRLREAPQHPHRRRAPRRRHRDRDDPGRDRRRARRERDRGPPRPAVADRDLHGAVRGAALDRRPPAGARRPERPPPQPFRARSESPRSSR